LDAIAPYDRPEDAFARMAKKAQDPIEPRLLYEALGLAAAQLGIKWEDWSGSAAIRQLKHPVLLIGGGRDTISTIKDMQVLEKSAPPRSKTLLLPEADHRYIAYWFRELSQPVKAWFQEHT
jgi:pimeloyl-ACP methyl ester carboxylesterase